MEDFADMFWPFSIPIVAIMGAFIYAIVQTLARARIRELEVRERIAMIERGLVPPPEKDPDGFDRAMARYDRSRIRTDAREWPGTRRTPARYRSAGVMLIGVGLGLMVLIGVAGGERDAAVGVGGMIVIIGMAFFVNSWLNRDEMAPLAPHPRPEAPTDPPQNP